MSFLRSGFLPIIPEEKGAKQVDCQLFLTIRLRGGRRGAIIGSWFGNDPPNRKNRMQERRKPRVFVTQVPHRRDVATGAFVPVVNIAPASEHGDVVLMMPSQASFFATGDLVKQLRKHLSDYDYEAGDCIVALGDPTVIAVAFALLGELFGRFIVLKWDRNIGRYLASHVDVWGDE